jgi:ribonuclease Z
MTHTDIFNIWNFHKELEGTNFSLKGHSRGGERTCFQIPAISLMFDAGLRTHQTPNHIFITHTHCDHFFDLPIILAGEDKHTDIYTPVNTKLVTEFIISSFKMMYQGGNKLPSFKVHQVNYNDIINFTENKRDYQVDVFKCYHRVKTVGYGISEIKNKLKHEYNNKSGPEIVALKKAGINISEKVKDPQVVYLTDTNIKVFNNYNIFDYKNIIVECTVLDEENKESAYKNGHIYWGDLSSIIESHPNNKFILIHFSTRYTDEYITEFFDKIPLTNVFPWLN